MKKFVLVDGNSLVHRSYHAVPKNLSTPEGTPSNAVYGFTSILLGILEQERPHYLAVAFDRKAPTFRDALFSEYKATRAKTDDSLIVQFPLVRSVLEAFSVPMFEKDGLEADDFLGIASEAIEQAHPDLQTVIVTGDKDSFQLVRGNVQVVTPVSGYSQVVRYDRDKVKEKMGVFPEQIPDYKGLCGDPSDNIPGVQGIGEKTAIKLLDQFGSVENLFDHLSEVTPPRVQELLRSDEAAARLCKQLATIVRSDPDFRLNLQSCEIQAFSMDAVRQLFTHFAFKSLLGRAEKLNRDWEKMRVNESQVSLF